MKNDVYARKGIPDPQTSSVMIVGTDLSHILLLTNDLTFSVQLQRRTGNLTGKITFLDLKFLFLITKQTELDFCNTPFPRLFLESL
jgi:hypothetical protein